MAYKLFEKDWLFILDTIYQLNAIGEREAFQREALKCLRMSIPCCQGIFYSHLIEDGRIVNLGDPVVLGDEALYLDEFHERYLKDSFFARHVFASRCEVIRDTDIYPEEVRTQTEWYKQIYVKQGIHYALRAVLTYNQQAVGEIDLFRPKSDPDFSETDMRVLDLLAPHVAQRLWKLIVINQTHIAARGLSSSFFDTYGLTPREGEVIAAIASGEPDCEIAQKLCISTSTLKKHIHNAYRKIGVRNRHQLFAALNSKVK